jgi:hypothetical protein
MNLMKKTREKKTAKRAKLEAIVMKTTFNTTSTVDVCTVFDVKDKTNVCIKLLHNKMNLEKHVKIHDIYY